MDLLFCSKKRFFCAEELSFLSFASKKLKFPFLHKTKMDLIFVTRKSFYFWCWKVYCFLTTSFLCFFLFGVAECKRSCKQSAKSFSVKCNKKDL
jgi:hypothetical protein